MPVQNWCGESWVLIKERGRVLFCGKSQLPDDRISWRECAFAATTSNLHVSHCRYFFWSEWQSCDALVLRSSQFPRADDAVVCSPSECYLNPTTSILQDQEVQHIALAGFRRGCSRKNRESDMCMLCILWMVKLVPPSRSCPLLRHFALSGGATAIAWGIPGIPSFSGILTSWISDKVLNEQHQGLRAIHQTTLQ